MKFPEPLASEKELLIPSNLIKELRDGNVLAWIGAGLSTSARYPSWTELIQSITQEIIDSKYSSDKSLRKWVEDNATKNPEWVAEVLLNANSHSFYAALRNIFDKKEEIYSFVHALLAILPFKGYVTTNYDCLIENHIEKFTDYKPKIYDYSTSLNLLTYKSKGKFIFKIHGDISKDHKNLILTESSFYKLEKNDIYYKTLSWIFSNHIIICLGHSLRDKDFRSFINERFNIFKADCPPIYVFIAESDTCKEEIDYYQRSYNINLVSISPNYNFQEIPSTLLSLYCLYHQIDSKYYGNDVCQLINRKLDKMYSLTFNKSTEETLTKAQKLLSVFKDDIDIHELNSICLENNISLSTAHIELIGKITETNRIKFDQESNTDDNRNIIAKWISDNIATIPIDNNPRFLSPYYKSIFFRYEKTLSDLLKYESSWNILVENTDKLKRIVEFYKQQGMWKEWLDIAQCALNYAKDEVKIELIRTMLSVYFWTRNYEKLNLLINEYPESDSGRGVNSYKTKLNYIKKESLKLLKCQLEKKITDNNLADRDIYYEISLLGRTYARLSKLTNDEKDSNNLLKKAEENLAKALCLAKKSKDFVEISVQYWYLSLVQIELNKTEEAKKNLAEVKRLDENIMKRIPGMAWLRLVEYRFALKEQSGDLENLKNIAKTAMQKLDIQNIEQYLDEEYFY